MIKVSDSLYLAAVAQNAHKFTITHFTFCVPEKWVYIIWKLFYHPESFVFPAGLCNKAISRHAIKHVQQIPPTNADDQMCL